MSTLKTNNIQHVDRSDPSIIINTDGSVNIAGTMTYEDVTNVDSVGIITARKQLHVGTGVSIAAGGLNVTAGISTFGGDVSIADKIIHTGDTNTAIRFPAADTFTVETAGSERLHIASDGKVGMGGATSPEEVLDLGNALQINLKVGGRGYLGQAYSTAATILGHSVKAKTTGTVSGGMEVTETNSGGGAPVAIRMQSGRFEFHTAASGTSGATFDSERLRITSDGQLIHNANKASGYIAEFHQDNSSNSAQILIDSPTDSNVRPTSVDFAQGGTVKWSLGQAYASSASQAFHIATSTLQTNESGSKVTIKTDGMLGIGTHNPNMTLHVLSSSDDVAKFQSTNSGNGAAISLDHIGSSPADNEYCRKVSI